MHRIILWLALTLLILTACAPTSTPSSAPSGVPVLTVTPTRIITITQAPTATLTRMASPTATPTLKTTETQQQADTVTFYRLQINFRTTSDWSTLDLPGSARILAARQVDPGTGVAQAYASLEQLGLNQPLSMAESGSPVQMTVDLAVDASQAVQPLKFVLQRGDLGDSMVRIAFIDEDQPILLKQVEHKGVTHSGTNPLSFSVNLTPLQKNGPQTAKLSKPDLAKMVWAFYYMWYTRNDWSSSCLKDWPLERYNSADPQVITKQIEQARNAGINGFISSWWGPGSDTDYNLTKLLDIAVEKDFKVSIYFETLAGENGTPLKEDKIYSWLAYAVNRYRDHPAFMKIDGKPVIFIWASAEVPLEAWSSIFQKLETEGLDSIYLAMGYNPANLEVFDGLHDYGVFTYQNIAQTSQEMGQAVRGYALLSSEATPKIWAATVQPGYDDTLQPSRQGLVQEREDGAFYRSTWEAALQSNPDWILITTWNGWYEHTHIEPSQAFGDQYLEITRKYAEQWKSE